MVHIEIPSDRKQDEYVNNTKVYEYYQEARSGKSNSRETKKLDEAGGAKREGKTEDQRETPKETDRFSQVGSGYKRRKSRKRRRCLLYTSSLYTPNSGK